MKIITTTIATLCLALSIASAQRTDTPIQISEISPIRTQTRTFYFSADVRASLAIDTALGEMDIPPFPPPSDLYLWTVVQAQEEIWFSPLDIRKLRAEKYVEEYHLSVQKDDPTLLRIGLVAGLPAFVDSVIVIDDIVSGPDYLVEIKLESGKLYDIENRAIRRFIVRIYYHGTTADVQDNNLAQIPMLSVAPNPVIADAIEVRTISPDATTLDIIDVRGVTCATYDVAGGDAKGLSVAHLPSGTYILAERRLNGSIRHCMFLRQ